MELDYHDEAKRWTQNNLGIGTSAQLRWLMEEEGERLRDQCAYVMTLAKHCRMGGIYQFFR